jgi:hypothetical protein
LRCISAASKRVQVVVWSGSQVDDFVAGTPGDTFFAVYDTVTNTVGPLQQVNTDHDMFCPGIATLPNGQVIVVAGSSGGDGAASSSFFNGATFVAGPKLNIPRGYNSAVTLANGKVRFYVAFLSLNISNHSAAYPFLWALRPLTLPPASGCRVLPPPVPPLWAC